MSTIYDEIGRGYPTTRRADPRIERAIRDALGDARSVVNVGAGTGSYEPHDRAVIAVEPSLRMIAQRPRDAARALQAVAERLPLRDRACDAALAILTVHHWNDPGAGLAELRRVARRRVVLFTWDPSARDRFWLTNDYVPEIIDFDVRRFPAIGALTRGFAAVDVRPVPVPHDCTDGFLAAFWRRPEAYLDASVRAGMSGFAQLPAGTADAGLGRLADDVRSGRWGERYAALGGLEALDVGYRLVIGTV